MNSRVDSHHHLWDLAITPQPWISGDEMAPIARSFGPDDLIAAAAPHVGRTVMVQTVTEAAETPVMLEYAAETDLIAGVVGWVDLTKPDVAETIDALQGSAHGDYLVGIRHQVQGEPDPMWLTRPDVRRGLSAVGAAGLVYDLLTIPVQLAASIETVRALPDVSFCLNHISKPLIADGVLDGWESEIGTLAESDNVTCKLSGMVTEADWARWTVDDLRPYADVVIEAFGPERVMFGSDWPVCLLAAGYSRVVEAAEALLADLSAYERSLVWGGTAVRVYGLDD